MSAKFIITGDKTQIDLPKNQKSGLIHAKHILKNTKDISFITLDEKDVTRKKLVIDTPDNILIIPESLRNKNLNLQEIIQLERESFGFPVSEYPLEKYQYLLNGKVIKAKDIPHKVNQTVWLSGILITRKITYTKAREPMEFVTFEDETDIYECIMFPKLFKKYADLLNWETLFILQGKIQEAFGVYTINIKKLESLQMKTGN